MRRLRFALLVLIALGAAASPRLRASAQPTVDINVQLVAGWNNVAYLGPTVPIGRFVGQVGPALRTLWMFDASSQSWRAYDARAPRASDLTEIPFQRAVWLQMTAPASLTMTPPQNTSAITLYTGLNNIAYAGPEAPLAEALASVSGRVRGIWRWDPAAQRWQGAVLGQPIASEFTVMSPGRAYSLQVTPGPTLTLGSSADARPKPPSRGCYSFQARQPALAEVRTAFNRAAFGALVNDPAFALPKLETDPEGDGFLTNAYIPPTLLKAIGWMESSWQQAKDGTARGTTAAGLMSSACAAGVMQVLTDMEIGDAPTPRQESIGTDYMHNIAAGARILAEKWNLAPDPLPVVRTRTPYILEDWYFAVWAYHCFGDMCAELNLHDNPDDPALTWPRPRYNSPEQLGSGGKFSRSDYPYQELVYGLVEYPPIIDGKPLWPSLSVMLPPPGTVTFPTPHSFERPGVTLDATRQGDP